MALVAVGADFIHDTAGVVHLKHFRGGIPRLPNSSDDCVPVLCMPRHHPRRPFEASIIARFNHALGFGRDKMQVVFPSRSPINPNPSSKAIYTHRRPRPERTEQVTRDKILSTPVLMSARISVADI